VATGAALAALSAGFAAGSALVAFRSEPEFKTFLAWLAAGGLAVAAILFASWTFCLATLSYSLRPGALVITWGLRRVIIPIDSIEGIVPGRTLDELDVRGINWFGCHVGHADVRRMGFTMVYATSVAPEHLVYLVTTDETYAITVLDQAGVAEEVQGRRVLGTVAHLPQRSSARGLAAMPFWRDRTAVTSAVLSAVAAAALMGYVFARYPSLPDIVQLDFPGFGGLIRIGDKEELLGIVYAGLAILGINSVAGIALHARERAAGLWVLASSGLLQLVLSAAAVVALERA
jgi:hypothetical protein